MSNPIIVNLFGGPSAGKSTIALGLSYFLKLDRANVELVPEVAKDFYHEKRTVALANQEYIFAKQLRNMRRVVDQYDIIVTDGPMLLCRYYDEKHGGRDGAFHQMMETRFQAFSGLNYFVERLAPYDPAGRYQTESEANRDAVGIAAMLDRLNVPHQRIVNDGTAVERILADVRAAVSARAA